MSKQEIEQIESMFYSLGIFEFNEEEQKYYLKISRHNLVKIFEELEKKIKED